MNNQRTLLLFALIFVGLLVVTLLQQPPASILATPSPETTPEVVQPQRLFSDWTAGDISALRLQDPLTQKTRTLQKNASGLWESLESDQAVNQTVAQAVIAAAVNLSYTRVLDTPSSEARADFGLDAQNAALFVQTILSSGEAHFVILGSRTPSGDSFYALVDERDGIYIIPRTGGAPDFLLLNLLGT